MSKTGGLPRGGLANERRVRGNQHQVIGGGGAGGVVVWRIVLGRVRRLGKARVAVDPRFDEYFSELIELFPDGKPQPGKIAPIAQR